MQGMNGIDFLYRAQATASTIGAIMITGHQIELAWQDLSQCRACGGPRLQARWLATNRGADHSTLAG